MISSQLSSINVTENISLACIASGYPAPIIMWTHNDTDFVETASNRFSITVSSHEFETQSVLYIANVTRNDTGSYACAVSSPIDTFDTITDGPVTILVQGKHSTSFAFNHD